MTFEQSGDKSGPPGRDQPLVSVVLPAFNAEAAIERALTSVARQDYPALELIVVDDASRDRTREILARHADQITRLITHEENRGPAAARNSGIAAANGTYVAFLDADDEWLEAKTSRQVAVMAQDPALAFVVCDGDFIAPDGQVVADMYSLTPPVAGPEAWRALLAYSFTAPCCLLADREALVRAGGFNEDLTVAEDQDLWIRLALEGPVGVMRDSLARVYLSSASHMVRHGHLPGDVLLPMIEAHVRAQRSRLSRGEVARILGRRYTEVGRDAYVGGSEARGLALLARAIGLGYRPLSNLGFLIHASPPGRWLKRRRSP